jgi:hypothetical protein
MLKKNQPEMSGIENDHELGIRRHTLQAPGQLPDHSLSFAEI